MTIPADKMMGRVIISLIAAATLVACDSAPVETSAPDINLVEVHCGTLIDGLADEPMTNKTVAIFNGRIDAILDGPPPTDHYIDLSDYTCLPGLIDTHTHLVEGDGDTADLSIFYTRSLEDEQEIARVNAAITLGAGFTTVRNVGAYNGWAGRVLRDRINSGEIVGPRMQSLD